jgi:hypothetical protein
VAREEVIERPILEEHNNVPTDVEVNLSPSSNEVSAEELIMYESDDSRPGRATENL